MEVGKTGVEVASVRDEEGGGRLIILEIVDAGIYESRLPVAGSGWGDGGAQCQSWSWGRRCICGRLVCYGDSN